MSRSHWLTSSRTLFTLVMVAALVWLAVPGVGTAMAATTKVDITNFNFLPPNLVVRVGDTVEWTNLDAAPHTVTVTDGPVKFDSGNLSRGQRYAHTFAQPGTYTYYCLIHPRMVGSVTVLAAGQQPATTAAVTPGLAGLGNAVGRDAKAQSDQITFTMSDVTPPSTGTVYEGWLVSDDGATKWSLGPIAVRGDRRVSHTFAHPEGANLLALGNRIAITLEPSPKTDPTKTGPVVFMAEIPTPVMAHIRHVSSAWAAAPNGTAFAVGLRRQIDLAATHALLADNEAKAGNMAGARWHAEHVVNIVEGSKGSNYGDVNRDGRTENPGDGFGVLAYNQGAHDHAGFAAAQSGASAETKLHAGHVRIGAQNVTGWTSAARDAALRIQYAGDIDEARRLVGVMVDSTQAARLGKDANGNARIELAIGEAGVPVVYEHAQNMAWFSLQPVAGPTALPSQLPRTGDAGTLLLATAGLFGALATAAGFWLRRRQPAAVVAERGNATVLANRKR
ncbi:MAG: cupredoxin domain-containing protein [Chloroflexi bacterium]|nr:cupredoxin domain-containing protein [Chloroflexota bacterium]